MGFLGVMHRYAGRDVDWRVFGAYLASGCLASVLRSVAAAVVPRLKSCMSAKSSEALSSLGGLMSSVAGGRPGNCGHGVAMAGLSLFLPRMAVARYYACHLSALAIESHLPRASSPALHIAGRVLPYVLRRSPLAYEFMRVGIPLLSKIAMRYCGIARIEKALYHGAYVAPEEWPSHHSDLHDKNTDTRAPNYNTIKIHAQADFRSVSFHTHDAFVMYDSRNVCVLVCGSGVLANPQGYGATKLGTVELESIVCSVRNPVSLSPEHVVRSIAGSQKALTEQRGINVSPASITATSPDNARLVEIMVASAGARRAFAPLNVSAPPATSSSAQ